MEGIQVRGAEALKGACSVGCLADSQSASLKPCRCPAGTEDERKLGRQSASRFCSSQGWLSLLPRQSKAPKEAALTCAFRKHD